MSRTDLVPEEVLNNPKFQKDIRTLLSMDSASLATLAENLPARPFQLSDEDFIARSAKKAGLPERDYISLSSLLKMISISCASQDVTSQEVLQFISDRTKLEGLIPSEHFLRVVEKIGAESQDAADNAFSFGRTYLGVSFTPLLTPKSKKAIGDGFFIGGNIQLDYAESGASRAFDLNLSIFELEEMIFELQRGLESLRNIENRRREGDA